MPTDSPSLIMADVAIAGAGPAGSIAALVLAQAGHSVCLIDDVQPDAPKVGESLPGAARPLLRDLGLLAQVEAGGHSPCYGNLSVWGSPEVIETDFIRDPNGLGWHLNRPKFDESLRQSALAAGGQYHRARVHSVQWSGEDWLVALSSGQEMTVRWVLDATGRRAAISRQLEAQRQRDDNLVAVVTWVPSTMEDRDTRTLVEAVPDGWWYTSRLPGKPQRVVVFHTEPEVASELRRSPQAWLTYLSEAHEVSAVLRQVLLTDELQAMVKAVNPFLMTEACGARLDRFWGEGWLAVGDAALSFDPLSSQGIFNALYTGMMAGRTVDTVLSGRQENALQGYTDQLESIRASYLRHHQVFYQAEKRWRDRKFWSQRKAVDA